jgi:hypothetical protein
LSLPQVGSTIFSGSVQAHSPGQSYEKKSRQMMLQRVFKEDPLYDTLSYRKWLHSVKDYIQWHCTDFMDDNDGIIWVGGVMDTQAEAWYDSRV